MLPDINIFMIPQFDNEKLIVKDNLHDIVLEDDSKILYKKYISDFAYIKLKFKLMPKIGLTGNRGCDLETVRNVFKDRGYEVIDIGKMISEALQTNEIMKPAFRELENLGIKTKKLTTTKNGELVVVEPAVIRLCLENQQARDIWYKCIQDYVKFCIMKQIMQSSRKIIVISTTLIFELNLDWMFKYMITVAANDEVIANNLKKYEKFDSEQIDDIKNLHWSISDKIRKSDWSIDANGDKNSIISNTIKLINKKLESNF